MSDRDRVTAGPRLWRPGQGGGVSNAATPEPCERLDVLPGGWRGEYRVVRCESTPVRWIPARVGTPSAARGDGAWFCDRHFLVIMRERDE